MMRVIAGEARGRRLKSGKGQKARPTSDRVKEALFNIIVNYIQDANFLDLFAGFGGIGIEALSRGAKKVIFVEKDPQHVKIIKENLNLTGFSEQAEVITGDVLKVLTQLHIDTSPGFQLIYIDPPYAEIELYQLALELISQRNLLGKDGVIICEHSLDLSAQVFDQFTRLKTKGYGESNLTFLGTK